VSLSRGTVTFGELTVPRSIAAGFTVRIGTLRADESSDVDLGEVVQFLAAATYETGRLGCACLAAGMGGHHSDRA
jgi:hypothetical protein